MPSTILEYSDTAPTADHVLLRTVRARIVEP